MKLAVGSGSGRGISVGASVATGASDVGVSHAAAIGIANSSGAISTPGWVAEQAILDLEREALLSLLGEEKTVARISHMQQTGKPLRN